MKRGFTREQRAIGAALFLLAKQHVPDWSGWPHSEAEILLLAGADRHQTQEIFGELEEFILGLECQFGPTVVDDPFEAVLYALGAFYDRHPNTGYVGGKPQQTEDFRRFAVALTAPGQPGSELSLDDLAFTLRVPLEVLEGWVAQSQKP
jgi:hypothetical protein